MFFDPMQIELDLDEASPLYLFALFNPPTLSELYIGLSEVLMAV